MDTALVLAITCFAVAYGQFGPGQFGQGAPPNSFGSNSNGGNQFGQGPPPNSFGSNLNGPNPFGQGFEQGPRPPIQCFPPPIINPTTFYTPIQFSYSLGQKVYYQCRNRNGILQFQTNECTTLPGAPFGFWAREQPYCFGKNSATVILC